MPISIRIAGNRQREPSHADEVHPLVARDHAPQGVDTVGHAERQEPATFGQVKQGSRDVNRGEHREQDAQDQRDGETANLVGADRVQARSP